MRKYLFTQLLFFFMPCAVWAKCGNSAIMIRGLITGPSVGATISVQVTPDPNWNSQPAAALDADGQFHITVYFDRTEPGLRERCSRKPYTVAVQLRRNGKLIDQVVLNIKKDFVHKDKSDYTVRSPVNLNSR